MDTFIHTPYLSHTEDKSIITHAVYFCYIELSFKLENLMLGNKGKVVISKAKTRKSGKTKNSSLASRNTQCRTTIADLAAGEQWGLIDLFIY